jgi:2-oxoglutarate dehydrogenase E1 component
MNPWDQFSGANAGYVYELYERYQRDPSSVDEATRRAFANWTPADPVAPAAPVAPASLQAGIAAFNLAESIRRFGHLAAQLDPLGYHDPIGDPSLAPQSHGLTTEALKQLPAAIVSGPTAAGAANAYEAIARLRQIYCSTTGHDYNHVSNRASSVRPTIRLTARSSSIASPRSRPSNDSCIAPFRERRASRSRAST